MPPPTAAAAPVINQNNNQSVEVPVSINVTAAGTDPEAVGRSIDDIGRAISAADIGNAGPARACAVTLPGTEKNNIRCTKFPGSGEEKNLFIFIIFITLL